MLRKKRIKSIRKLGRSIVVRTKLCLHGHKKGKQVCVCFKNVGSSLEKKGYGENKYH